MSSADVWLDQKHMISFSFRYNPLTANQLGVLLGGVSRILDQLFISNIMISKIIIGFGSIPVAMIERPFCAKSGFSHTRKKIHHWAELYLIITENVMIIS